MEVNTIWLTDTVHKIDGHICRNMKGMFVKRDEHEICRGCVNTSTTTNSCQRSVLQSQDQKNQRYLHYLWTMFSLLLLSFLYFKIEYFQRHEETGDFVHVLSIDIRCKLLWLILVESLTRTSLRMEKFILFCSTTQPCLDFWAKYESSNRSFIS